MKNILTFLFALTITTFIFGQTDTSQYVIIITDGWASFPGSKPTTLTKIDLSDIDILVKQSIDNYNSKQNKEDINNCIKLPEYKRQYIAVINKKGEKEVWVNCFCNTGGKNWKKEIIHTDEDDGGKCFFNLKINLTTKKYYDLFVDGKG